LAAKLDRVTALQLRAWPKDDAVSTKLSEMPSLATVGCTDARLHILCRPKDPGIAALPFGF